MTQRRSLTALAAAVLVLAGCSDAPPAESAAEAAPEQPRRTVYVGSYPLRYFAERIGGDRVQVELPLPAGTDPATWTPSPETVLAYQGADLVLLNGATYEGWTATATLPSEKVVDTSAGFADQYIAVANAVTHSHGPEGEHSHDATASATWLDPELALRQAEAVRDALVALEPESEARFREGFEALASDLRGLDEALRAATAGAAGRTVLAAVPAYEYLARRYDLDVRSFRYDPADAAASGFLHDVGHAVPRGETRTMLWPADPPADLRGRLEEMRVRSVVFDPAGAPPASGDYLSIMTENARRLAEALAGD